MNKLFEKGVTLVELMVTVSIVSVMLALAMPSFQGLILNNRQIMQTNEFVLAMAYAKSEAVKRGLRVTVCARATNVSCAADTRWDNGWLVFVDSSPPYGTVNGDDIVLQVRSPIEGGNSLRSNAHSSLTFQSNGFLSPGNFDTFNLCDVRGAGYGPRIFVSQQGRVSTKEKEAACSS